MDHSTDLMTGSHLYALYGSLRIGMSNRDPFVHALEAIKTIRIPGFRMYALRHYPYVVETGSPADTIVVEITRVTDPATEQKMIEFEASVGYQVKKVHHEGLEFSLFIFPQAGAHRVVEGGDWVEFAARR
ncbi:MAG: gamma-glutamylcyclotransferase family protein [Bacteroidota bacterium]